GCSVPPSPLPPAPAVVTHAHTCVLLLLLLFMLAGKDLLDMLLEARGTETETETETDSNNNTTADNTTQPRAKNARAREERLLRVGDRESARAQRLRNQLHSESFCQKACVCRRHWC